MLFDFQSRYERFHVHQLQLLHHRERTLLVLLERRPFNVTLVRFTVGIYLKKGHLVRIVRLGRGIELQYTRLQPHRGLDLLFQEGIVGLQLRRINRNL